MNKTKPQILVVDDVALNREFANIILQQLGYEVTEARDGAEALAALSEAPFDLILMDIEMPVMDGFTAVSRIRETDSRTPILAFTTQNNREQCLSVGMNDHLAKPVDLEQVKEKVQFWLKRAA